MNLGGKDEYKAHRKEEQGHGRERTGANEKGLSVLLLTGTLTLSWQGLRRHTGLTFRVPTVKEKAGYPALNTKGDLHY